MLAKKKSKSFFQVLEGKLFTWDSKTRGKNPAIFTTSVILFSILLDEISRHTLSFYFTTEGGPLFLFLFTFGIS